MAEWIGVHIQGWPLWAIILVIIGISVIWVIGAWISASMYGEAYWPFTKRKYLGEKRDKR